MMAERAGSRVIFFSPLYVSFDSRGREMKLAPGIKSPMASRIVCAPSSRRLGAAAGVQQTIGEDVAALGIAAELNFVDREKIDVDVARHRLDGRYPIARPFGLDFFLACNQRDVVGADARFDLVVDLARQETQRQTDHAAFVAEHALYGEMRLAGVRRSKHRGYVTNAGFEITNHVVLDSGSGPGIAERGHEIKGLFRFFRLDLEPL